MTANNPTLKFHITFRNLDSSEALKQYAVDKITNCMNKFIHHDTDVHVILKVEKNRQNAEVTFHSEGADFTVDEECGTMYTSIDKLVDSLAMKLRKHKEKMTAHHA